jgi:Uncharacterised protein conserved in bacteria (DUF2336)
MSMAYLQMLARAPGRRDALLRELTDIFVESQRNPRERELFDDVVDQVLDFVDAPARQHLAERLAMRADAPHRVMVRLAADAIAIAAPVLARSPVLTDDDLITLAREKSQDHLAAIARRGSLPASVTDVLIARARADVLEAVAANPAARFSASGAEALVDKARDRETLWRRLARRRDVAIAGAPWPHQETGAPPRLLDVILDEVAREMIRFADAVVELADADRITDLATLVCTRLAVDVPVLVHEMFAPNEVRLFHRCCEARLDLDALSAVMRLRKRHHPLDAQTISGMLLAWSTCEADTHAPSMA